MDVKCLFNCPSIETNSEKMIDTFAETLQTRFQTLPFLLIFSFIALWMAHRLGLFRLPPEDTSYQPIPFKYFGYALLILFGSQLVALPFPRKVWSIIGPLATAVLLLVYIGFLSSEIRKSIRFKESKEFLFGAVTWLVAFPVVGLLSQLSAIALYYFFGNPEAVQTAARILKSNYENPLIFYSIAFTIACVVPLIEEIVFRGFLQNYFKKFFNRPLAIIFSSIIFALFHFTHEQGLTNIEFIFVLFILSCFLGLIYERQNSLWAPIGLHMVFNTVSILIMIAGQ